MRFMEAKSKFFDPGSVKIAVKNGSIWSQVLPWAYGAAILLIVVLAVGVIWPVLKRNHQLNASKEQMEQKIEDGKKLSLSLQVQNAALQSDPVYIERKARDVLNVGRKGEVIFKFPPYQKVGTNVELRSSLK
jgi:cell division protein FtsB